ncbi:MAG: S49 family peptidase [Clostridia bacterium]|nr:S49 family peptidase [Clostridia bacterium]
MGKKQIIWLIVAILLFLLTGWIGVNSAISLNQTKAETSGSLMEMLENLIYGSASNDPSTFSYPEEDFIALVRIEGTIEASSGDSYLYSGGGYDHGYVISYINSLIPVSSNKGILLYIDSPGGTLAESDELYLTLMDYRDYTGRPVYAYCQNACSGAYYAAMAADHICVNRNGVFVNIGVYISTYDMSALFEKIGVETVTIKSGENKGIGILGNPWTDEQKEIYQSMIDESFEQFLGVVADGRGWDIGELRQKVDGREMSAQQALRDGYVDQIDRFDAYLDAVLSDTGCEWYVDPPRPSGLPFDLSSFLSSLFPRSESQILLDFAKNHDGIKVMAYAENH